jgi:VWFA-related protein
MKKALGSICTVVLFLTPAAFGQTQEPATQEPGVTIRQTVQEVVLEVMARDARGRVVKNLKPSDLEVYEDGVRQQIQSFKFIEGREVMSQTSKAPAPATQRAGGVLNPLKAVNLVCIVFSNLDAYNKKFAVDAVQEFLKSQLDPDTWVAVFNLDSLLTVLHPFTNNRNEIMEAANRASTGTGVDFASIASSVLSAAPLIEYIEVTQSGNMASGGTVSATQKVSGGELNPSTIVGADVSNSQSANIQRGDLAAQRREFGGIEGMREMEQILAMIRQLGTLPGRKSVLLLSPGLVATGDPDLFKSMVDKANKANVTVYAIDVNGLSAELDQSKASSNALSHAASLSSSQGNRNSSNSAAASMERMRQGDYVNDAVRTMDTQSSLRALSESTGGFLIGSTNDLRKPFQRLVEDVETHYEVIYRPSSTVYDGRLRTINVKTLRADLNVESRKGYFALPVLSSSADLSASEVAGLAALSLKEAPHAFEFKAAAYQFRPNAANSQNDMVFEIPAANLTATPEPAVKRHRMHVALLALIKDANGQVVDKFSQDSPYEIPDENLTKAQATSITFTHALALAPGHYTLETAALDQEANRSSISKVAFDSPEQKGVGLSSIMLVQHMEPVKGKVEQTNPLEFQPDPAQGQRVIPELATNLTSSATPYVFFVVYPDRTLTDKPKIQAEFLVGGQVLAKQVADLPAPDATGAIPMVINTAAKPGNCELRITALQGNSSAKQSLTYSIAAK